MPLVSPGIESSKGNKILRSDTIYSKDKKEETETDDLISSSPEWLTIQKNLKDKIKMKKSANGDEKFINPIVKLFGNVRFSEFNNIIFHFQQIEALPIQILR